MIGSTNFKPHLWKCQPLFLKEFHFFSGPVLQKSCTQLLLYLSFAPCTLAIEYLCKILVLPPGPQSPKVFTIWSAEKVCQCLLYDKDLLEISFRINCVIFFPNILHGHYNFMLMLLLLSCFSCVRLCATP